MKVYIKDNGLIPELPNPLPTATGPMYGASEADYAAHGYYTVDAPDCDRKYWVPEGDSIREMTPDEKTALAAQEAQAAEQAQADRIAAIPEDLWQIAAAFRGGLRQLFLSVDHPETDRNITEQVVMGALLQVLSTGQGAELEIIIENGFQRITAWTGTNESWSFPWAMLPEGQL